MASAYGSFANNGVHVTSHAIEKIQDSNGKDLITPQVTQERVMKETTAYLMNDLLRSVVTNGTGTRAQIGNWAVAGKTGTTSLDPKKYGNITGSPDAWFAGYTPNYVGVVWMGYDEDPDKKHYLHNVFGGSYPAQIWKQVMTKALEDEPVQSQFKKPAGIVSGAIDTKSGLLPSSLTPSQFIRTELAAQGDLPTQSSNVWVEKEIDADHPTYLAGDKTRNKVTKVFLNITDRSASAPWPSDEAPYKPPTEVYNGDGKDNSDNLAAVDPRLPIPTLGPVAYDSAKKTASMAVSYPQGSEALTLVLYIKFPDQSGYQPFTPQAQPGKSNLITVPLDIDGETAPGEYVFKAAFKDPKTLKYSETSPVARLTIQSEPGKTKE
jgi:penicillin-binding protein 1A